jgi:tRNA-Thr(GGU) m(6)t(6)A37 methyltransferase TsaA
MQIEPIATVRSDFEGRFGTPRQPGLVPEARAEVVLRPAYARPEALHGLEDCSDIWLVFGFHAMRTGDWRPTVRPPRLGGNQRLGVFATRSPYRPNQLGLSLVRLEGRLSGPSVGLAISGQDLMDGTPVYDIKPYLPAIESRPDARLPNGFERAVAPLSVAWEPMPYQSALAHGASLVRLIEQTIAADPRPAYHRRRADECYGMTLLGYSVRWRVVDQSARVTEVCPVASADPA